MILFLLPLLRTVHLNSFDSHVIFRTLHLIWICDVTRLLQTIVSNFSLEIIISIVLCNLPCVFMFLFVHSLRNLLATCRGLVICGLELGSCLVRGSWVGGVCRAVGGKVYGAMSRNVEIFPIFPNLQVLSCSATREVTRTQCFLY